MSTSALYGYQGCAVPTSEDSGHLWWPSDQSKLRRGCWLGLGGTQRSCFLTSSIKHHSYVSGSYVCMGKHACGSLGWTSLNSLRQSLLLNLELVYTAILASQLTLGISSLCLQAVQLWAGCLPTCPLCGSEALNSWIASLETLSHLPSARLVPFMSLMAMGQYLTSSM